MKKTIRIHLADDHKVLIDGMRTLLNSTPNFNVVGFSLKGTTLYEEVTNNATDILVLDINMPEKDGIEVLKEFSKKGYPCKVIVLSSYEDVKIIQEVMKLGASGYLTKQCAGENIVEAIQVVNTGEEYFSNQVREIIFNSATKKTQN
ncbi:response regulator transcription factor [Flavobacterium nitratireducens]|uniref:response regulator n=1 Tax=Flavobacterium nitratireducens TaxID=992289 RepID=UPI0030FB4EAD